VLLASLFGDKDNSDIKNIIRKSYNTHRRGVKEEGYLQELAELTL